MARRIGDRVLISFQYQPDIHQAVMSLPNKWYRIKQRGWEIPAADLTLLRNRVRCEITGLEMGLQRKPAGLERLDGIEPIIPFNFKTEPFPHQIEGFNTGISRNTLLIADEQGLGKTKQAIDIAVARKRNGVKGVLIICGVNSVKYNWLKEVRTHSNETAQVIDGTNKEKLEKLTLTSQYYFSIINVESLRKKEILAELVRLVERGILGLIIFDEVHKAKNGECSQGKALLKLNSPFKIALTGTPITSKAEDLHNILVWLGYERSNIWQFRYRYCVYGGYMNKKIVGYQNLDELNRKLNRAMLRRKKADVFDLPPKIYSVEYVELTKKQKAYYTMIRNGILRRIDEIMLLPNPLTELIRLRECTAGLEVLGADGKDNPKLDRVKEMLEETIVPSGAKAVIFSNFEKVTKVLKRELAQYNPAYITGAVSDKKRQGEVEKFQTGGSCKVIIGTIGAMGTGLTLTAGTYVIFMDKAWTSADNEQAEDRCHRIGTTGTVNVITMVAQNTIDERVEDLVQEKKDLFDVIVEGREVTQTDRNMVRRLIA